MSDAVNIGEPNLEKTTKVHVGAWAVQHTDSKRHEPTPKRNISDVSLNKQLSATAKGTYKKSGKPERHYSANQNTSNRLR